MVFFETLEGDFGFVQAFDDDKAYLCCRFNAGGKELLAFIAPIVTRSGSTQHPVLGNGLRLQGFKLVYIQKEGVVVQALELDCILAFANTEGCREAFSFIS